MRAPPLLKAVHARIKQANVKAYLGQLMSQLSQHFSIAVTLVKGRWVRHEQDAQHSLVGAADGTNVGREVALGIELRDGLHI